MEIYSKTDIGRKRSSNQDAVTGKIISKSLAWTVVCDGMGGASGGDIASNEAVEEISKVMGFINDKMNKENILELMNSAIQSANTVVFDRSQRDESLHGMGTTVVLAVVSGSHLYVMHAGDSRAYLISGNNITQIGVDHSIVQEMVDSGEITSTEARNHTRKNIITRALGIGNLVELDCNTADLKPEDIVLVCSDGLSNHLEDDEIFKIAKEKSLKTIADLLIDKCNSRGGKDNITVSLVRLQNGSKIGEKSLG